MGTVLDDPEFPEHIAEHLAGLPGVRAVSLGGSRAAGSQHAGSDWDFALYYRGAFDPEDLRALGWSGEVSEIGAWGGVFNGGAWLAVDGRHVDVHYRDLDDVEFRIAQARAGHFEWQPLLFHLAGIPSYLVVGELAVHRVLRGVLPHPEFPEPLRRNAPGAWWAQASLGLTYARANHAVHGRLTQVAGTLAQAACQTAHAVLAAQAEWPGNEKRLVARAGLSDVDELISALTADPAALIEAVDHAHELFATAIEAARGTGVGH